jgi:hypothetical protein
VVWGLDITKLDEKLASHTLVSVWAVRTSNALV